MFEEIEKAWSFDADGYDDLIQNHLSSKREIEYWTNELKSAVGEKALNILDVGCGPGFFSILLSRMGHRVTAVDGAPGMIACAKKNFEVEKGDIRFFCGDVVTLTSETANTYDIIISRDVVWTLYDPEQAFKRWKQLLKPGGKLIIYDGDYRKEHHTVGNWMLRQASKIVLAVTEKKPKETYHTDAAIFDELPMVLSKRPEKDMALLKETGYESVAMVPDKFRNSPTRLEYWKYGYQGKKFCVKAKKPSSEL
jgi:2-polyprenyl-3-methyl-5-hydroxy-6-metoxy-1,4-benzoquinol methylase